MKSTFGKLANPRLHLSSAALFKALFITAVLLTVVSLFSGCSSDNQNLSYQYSLNGCDTGKHEFDNKGAYCAGLQNDTLNNGCAVSLRQAAYQSNCP